MEDLVAVGVADPCDERLVTEQVLELAWMSADPVAPDVKGQGRVVRLGPHLLRRQPGDGPFDAGRQQVHLAHLGGVAVADLRWRVTRRQPGRPAGPPRGLEAGWRVGLAEPQDDRRLGRQLGARGRELETPSEHRVDDHTIAIEIDLEELAVSPDGPDGLSDEGVELCRRPPDGQWTGGNRAPDRPSAERCVEGLGDDREVGYFGAGPRWKWFVFFR